MRIPRLGPRGDGWVVGQLVLLAAIGLAGLDAFLHPNSADAVRVVAGALGAAAIAAGGIVAARGVLDLGSSLTPFPRPSASNQLVDVGVYRHVRHPIYAGIVLASLGWGVATLAPLAIGLAAVLFLWFDLKSRAEETWLIERHPGYASYRSRTRRFIPLVY